MSHNALRRRSRLALTSRRLPTRALILGPELGLELDR